MSSPVNITCPKCSQPIMFNLPSKTTGSKCNPCRKCGKLVSIYYVTAEGGNIHEVRIINS